MIKGLNKIELPYLTFTLLYLILRNYLPTSQDIQRQLLYKLFMLFISNPGALQKKST